MEVPRYLWRMLLSGPCQPDLIAMAFAVIQSLQHNWYLPRYL